VLDGGVDVVAERGSVAKCRLEVSDVLLGLFDKWSQSLGYVGQLEFIRLGEPLSVAFQLLASSFRSACSVSRESAVTDTLTELESDSI
jgi:hypothetical protein